MINEAMLLFLLLNPSLFLGYMGPGMGGGVIAAIFGIITAFFLGLWGILYYPVKRFFKNRKKKLKKVPKRTKNKI